MADLIDSEKIRILYDIEGSNVIVPDYPYKPIKMDELRDISKTIDQIEGNDLELNLISDGNVELFLKAAMDAMGVDLTEQVNALPPKDGNFESLLG